MSFQISIIYRPPSLRRSPRSSLHDTLPTNALLRSLSISAYRHLQSTPHAPQAQRRLLAYLVRFPTLLQTFFPQWVFFAIFLLICDFINQSHDVPPSQAVGASLSLA